MKRIPVCLDKDLQTKNNLKHKYYDKENIDATVGIHGRQLRIRS